MTETIKEQILADVETALLLPDGDSSGSSYYFSIGTGQVHRGEASMTQIENGPYPLITVSSVQTVAETGSSAGADTYWFETMQIEVVGWIADQTNVDRDLSRLEHDIRKALWTDYTRSGLALTTLWDRTEVWHPMTTEDRALVVVYFSIRFEVKLSDLTDPIP